MNYMKKVLLLTSLLITCGNGQPITGVSKVERITQTPVIKPQIKQPIIITPHPIDELIDALIYVESRGKDSAIGDTHLKEPSVGVLQIRPVMVREVNRILKIQGNEERFNLKDRFDREKSILMFRVWQNYHHSDNNLEEIARSWNGGPKGVKNKRTEKYWIKVKEQLNK